MSTLQVATGGVAVRGPVRTVLVTVLLVGGTALGVLAALTTREAATYMSAIGLFAPVAVGARMIRRDFVTGSALLVFALGLALVLGSRLLVASPDRGLLSYVSMSREEFDDARRLGNMVLSLFGIAVATAMATGKPLPARRQGSPVGAFARPRRRAETTVCVALTVVGVAGALLTATPSMAPGLEVGASAPGQLMWQLTNPVPALLVLRRRRLTALLLAVPICLVPVLGGRRQALLTPLVFLVVAWMATREGVRPRTRLRQLATVGIIFAVLIAAIAALSLSRRADTVAAVYRGEDVGLLSVIVQDQVGTDLLYLAIAREPRPRPLDLFERVLTLPIPRAFWPGKPLSYDFEFRERHFPAFGGALPISLVGTSFLGFLLPGVLLSGFLVGRLVRYAASLLARSSAQAVLFGIALLLFALDIVRVGGLYREILTFLLSCAAIRGLVPGDSKHGSHAAHI